MRMTESKPDDLKILQAKEFLQVFDDKVLIILDWKENNYLRSDRYTPSKYLEIYKKEMLEISGVSSGIPNGDTGKVSSGKVSSEEKESKSHCNSDELPVEAKKPKKAPKLYYKKYTGKQLQELFLITFKRRYGIDMICVNFDWINFWKILDKLIPETPEYHCAALFEYIFTYLEETWYYDKTIDKWKVIPTPSKIMKMLNEILQYLKMTDDERESFNKPKKKFYKR
jgi:hypothetical protein